MSQVLQCTQLAKLICKRPLDARRRFFEQRFIFGNRTKILSRVAEFNRAAISADLKCHHVQVEQASFHPCVACRC